MDTSGVWGIVVAAGSGRRFGASKQFVPLGRQRVVDLAVAAARRVCAGLVVVLPPGAEWDGPDVDGVAEGGATRSDSVRAGLALVPEGAEVVVVHDAARPLASSALFAAVVAAVRAGADAAVPGVPVADTLKRVEDGAVAGTVERDALVAVQTPQAFRVDVLRAAHAAGGEATDDAALVEGSGHRVVVVPGEAANLKLTGPDDLRLARALEADGSGGGRRVVNRVGLGFDVHPFGGDGPLVLAGVTIGGPGLVGHSDADVVAHAVADALLGAAGLPDLGTLFPAGDDRYRGADSLVLLAEVAGRVAAGGWTIANVDVVVVAEAPRLAPHLEAMAANLARTLGGSAGAVPVSVKPKRAEGLGAIGRVEGIAAMAVALLEGDAPDVD